MTSNVFSVAGSLGAKAYLKQNPPKLDVELKELGIDDESAGVKIPATLEEALVDARLNAQPVRAPIRPGINAVPAFLAVDVGDLDVGVSDEIAFVDEIQFVDELPDPVPEAPAAPQAAAADTSSVNELYSR